MYKVRLADYMQDINGFTKLAKEFSKEDALFADKYDEKYIPSILENICSNKNIVPLLAVDEEEKVVGVLFLTFAPLWYNTEYSFFEELLFYVMVEHRGKGAGKLLIDAAKELADENDIPLVIHLLTRDRLKLKERLMNRQGLSKQGSIMAYGG